MTFSRDYLNVCGIPVIREQIKAPHDSVKFVGAKKDNRLYVSGSYLIWPSK